MPIRRNRTRDLTFWIPVRQTRNADLPDPFTNPLLANSNRTFMGHTNKRSGFGLPIFTVLLAMGAILALLVLFQEPPASARVFVPEDSQQVK